MNIYLRDEIVSSTSLRHHQRCDGKLDDRLPMYLFLLVGSIMM